MMSTLPWTLSSSTLYSKRLVSISICFQGDRRGRTSTQAQDAKLSAALQILDSFFLCCCSASWKTCSLSTSLRFSLCHCYLAKSFLEADLHKIKGRDTLSRYTQFKYNWWQIMLLSVCWTDGVHPLSCVRCVQELKLFLLIFTSPPSLPFSFFFLVRLAKIACNKSMNKVDLL